MTQNAERTAANLIGVDPPSGRVLFSHDGWREQWGALGVDPIVAGGKIFITSAEQFRQAARFTIAGGGLRQDWTTNRVAGYTGCAVLVDAHLYLVDSSGILKCVAWETGDVKWQQRGFGDRGSLIAAGKELLIQTSAASELVVAAADASQYRELRRAQYSRATPQRSPRRARRRPHLLPQLRGRRSMFGPFALARPQRPGRCSPRHC